MYIQKKWNEKLYTEIQLVLVINFIDRAHHFLGGYDFAWLLSSSPFHHWSKQQQFGTGCVCL